MTISLLVAGQGGNYATSTDGVTWTHSTFGPLGNVFGIVLSSDLNLAVLGGGNSIVTYNGTTFTARTSPITATWEDGAWSPSLGLFVLVGETSYSAIATSPDGITWTDQSSAAPAFGPQVRGVAWSPSLGLFAAVGDVWSGSGGLQFDPLILSSSDGTAWADRTPSIGNGDPLYDVAWSPDLGMFVAVGSTFWGPYTSTDGATWTEPGAVAWPGWAQTWFGVCWSSDLGMFAAVGTGGSLATSSDGATWSTSTPFGSTQMNDIAWSSALGLFVAGGLAGALYTSPDGSTWTSHTSGFGANSVNAVAELDLTIAATGRGLVLGTMTLN